jgi:hypothetical protein
MEVLPRPFVIDRVVKTYGATLIYNGKLIDEISDTHGI